MNRLIASMLFLAASVSFATPQTVEAQLGGLIKKKVKEAVKPAEKPAEPASPASGTSSAPTESPSGRGGGSHGLPTLSGDVLVINAETLARAQRGMDAELALVADFQKLLAKYPTQKQYTQCIGEAMGTPEGLKVMEKLMNPPGNESLDQMNARLAKIDVEAKAVQKKHCPLDPDDWQSYKRKERLAQIHAKAASMAFVSAPKSDTPADTASDTVLVVRGDGLQDREYSLLIERIFKYCELYKSMDMSPKGGGIRVPGLGKDIYWVFTEEELAALKAMSCDAFIRKYSKLIALDL